MEITKREILVAIIIFILLICFGFLIHTAIQQKLDDQNQIYDQALKIDKVSDFEYGLKTSIGHAFIFGTLKAVDTVSLPDIPGEYIRIEKTKERYTQHTYTSTDSKGHTTVHTYWSWDTVDRDLFHSNEVSFMEHIFPYDKFNISTEHYLDTLYESPHVRYIYYVTDTEYVGTIFTKLSDGTISDNTNFYEGQTIEQVNESLHKRGLTIILFWIGWLIITGLLIYGFFYLENRYLY